MNNSVDAKWSVVAKRVRVTRRVRVTQRARVTQRIRVTQSVRVMVSASFCMCAIRKFIKYVRHAYFGECSIGLLTNWYALPHFYNIFGFSR